MNWLAHLHLADPTPEARVGSLLPDLVGADVLHQLSGAFQSGIVQHRWIDRYTDAHPVVHRSAGRVSPDLRRFRGICVDIFYDHFLARRWEEFSLLPRQTLIAEFYASLDVLRPQLPPEVYTSLHRIRSGAWLESYADFSGLQRVLTRLGQRLQRPRDLSPAVRDLEAHYHDFERDFLEFYPALQRAVRAWEIGDATK